MVHEQEPLLFHHEDRGYAAVEDAEGTCRRTWDIKGKAFKQWLISLYFDETHFGPSSEALSATINTLEAEAIFHGREQTVFLRIGRHEGKIYIDLVTMLGAQSRLTRKAGASSPCRLFISGDRKVRERCRCLFRAVPWRTFCPFSN